MFLNRLQSNGKKTARGINSTTFPKIFLIQNLIMKLLGFEAVLLIAFNVFTTGMIFIFGMI